ncbi:uncharacterized protein LOC114714593 [Neltuma alba]|uniref:uncharacterized protein LOC114714593 n=1 Tax=Neltuma alba TaxID=207710 RepID=UPI0010A30E3E|nr:uncharacterized protein LOC114714593 [Prosopis alba]
MGELRVDVDASAQGNQQATCGGVVRDHRGKWVIGFTRKLGNYLVVAAEILAIKAGMEVCKSLNIRDFQIHSDSLEAISTLVRDSGINHPFRQEIEETRKLIYEE